jgi:type VI secretion system secreted protein Hcp
MSLHKENGWRGKKMKTLKKQILVMSMVISFISVTSVFAATIDLDGVKATLTSYTMGLTMSGTMRTGGGGGGGKVSFQDITINRPVDELGPFLMLKCATGQRINKVVITGDNGSVFTLVGVIVTSYSENGFSDSTKAYSQVTLNFSKITFANKGKSSTWNVVENKGG